MAELNENQLLLLSNLIYLNGVVQPGQFIAKRNAESTFDLINKV